MPKTGDLRIDRFTVDALASYSPTDAAIAEMSERYMPLVVADLEDKAGLVAVHTARMDVKRHRVAVEKTRKTLKADALEFGRRIDGEAKRLTALLSPIEEHLAHEEGKIEAEKERLRQKEEERKRETLRLRVDALAAVQSAHHPLDVERMSDEEFQAALAKDTADFEEGQRIEAEEAEVRSRAEAEERHKTEEAAEEARVERERLDAERAEVDAERQRVDAERQRVEDARRSIERERELEQAKKKAAAEALEEERLATERDAREEEKRIQREADEAVRIEAARPEIEKLRAFAHALDGLELPDVPSRKEVRAIMGVAALAVMALAEKIEEEKP